MPIKCVLFDVDGVIVTSERFSIQYHKKYHVSMDVLLDFFNGKFKDCIIGKADLLEEIQPWLLKWNWKGTAQELLDYWFKISSTVNNDLISIIKELRKKGIVCCVATNQEKHRFNYMKKNMNFNNLFDSFFSSSIIGYKKPHECYFEFVLEKIKQEFSIHPNEILFFDDTKKHIESAQKLGIISYHYTDLSNLKSTLSKFTNIKLYK
jgi:putative hydrolase of the HAD superfamily